MLGVGPSMAPTARSTGRAGGAGTCNRRRPEQPRCCRKPLIPFHSFEQSRGRIFRKGRKQNGGMLFPARSANVPAPLTLQARTDLPNLALQPCTSDTLGFLASCGPLSRPIFPAVSALVTGQCTSRGVFSSAIARGNTGEEDIQESAWAGVPRQHAHRIQRLGHRWLGWGIAVWSRVAFDSAKEPTGIPAAHAGLHCFTLQAIGLQAKLHSVLQVAARLPLRFPTSPSFLSQPPGSHLNPTIS